jgi:hypothetical protein
MGWESRDWAKWTDEERTRYVGGSGHVAVAVAEPARASRRPELVLLAALVSAAGSFLAWHAHLFRAAPAPRPALPPLPAVVYGTGSSHMGGYALTCTAMTRDVQGTISCTAWSYVMPGQRVEEPVSLPPGVNCPAIEADQQAGHWVCSAP